MYWVSLTEIWILLHYGHKGHNGDLSCLMPEKANTKNYISELICHLHFTRAFGQYKLIFTALKPECFNLLPFFSNIQNSWIPDSKLTFRKGKFLVEHAKLSRIKKWKLKKTELHYFQLSRLLWTKVQTNFRQKYRCECVQTKAFSERIIGLGKSQGYINILRLSTASRVDKSISRMKVRKSQSCLESEAEVISCCL